MNRHGWPRHTLVFASILAVSACGGGGGDGGGTTAIKTWSTPERISFANNLFGAGSPEVATDANGNAVAIYSDATSGAGGAVVNRYTPGTGWGQPTVISTPPATNNPAFPTDIAIAPGGEAVGVFRQDSRVLSSHLTPPSVWNTPQFVDTSTLAARGVQFAMDTSGRGTAAWIEDGPGGDDNLLISNYTPGGNWGVPVSIDGMTDSIPNNSVVAIAADASGRVYVTWPQTVGSGISLFAAFSNGPTSSVWTTELVDTLSPDARSPDISVNATGTAFLVWQQSTTAGQNEKIWARRRLNSSSVLAWEAPVRLDIDTGFSPNAARVAVDNNGNAIAIWGQADGTNQTHIWSNRYVAGTGWGTAQRIDTAFGPATGHSLAIHPNGEAIAAWNQLVDMSSTRPAWAAHFRPQTGWAVPVPLQNGSGIISGRTAVTIDSVGNAFAIWESIQQPSSVSKMWASQYR